MPCYSRCKTLVPVNPQAWLIISLNIKDAFRNFLANDTSHVKKAYKAYKWLCNKYEEGVVLYNQLLKDKETMNENNNRLRQEKDVQRESVLRMEGALTYVEEQVAEL